MKTLIKREKDWDLIPRSLERQSSVLTTRPRRSPTTNIVINYKQGSGFTVFSMLKIMIQ